MVLVTDTGLGMSTVPTSCGPAATHIARSQAIDRVLDSVPEAGVRGCWMRRWSRGRIRCRACLGWSPKAKRCG